jgi:hypothetical protein
MTLIVQNTLDPQLYNTLATLTGSQILANKTIKSAKESVTVVNAAPASTTNFDVVTQSIVVYNTSTNNFTLNVRGDANTALNSLLAVGESVTVSLFVPNGSTAYYPTAYQIDGIAITPKYQGAVVFNQGNANCTDLYVLFLIKLANNSWSAYVSQTKFA